MELNECLTADNTVLQYTLTLVEVENVDNSHQLIQMHHSNTKRTPVTYTIYMLWGKIKSSFYINHYNSALL